MTRPVAAALTADQLAAIGRAREFVTADGLGEDAVAELLGPPPGALDSWALGYAAEHLKMLLAIVDQLAGAAVRSAGES